MRYSIVATTPICPMCRSRLRFTGDFYKCQGQKCKRVFEIVDNGMSDREVIVEERDGKSL